MTPQHHLATDWMVAAARGTLSDAAHLVVQTHLVFCPECRWRLRRLEEEVARQLPSEAVAVSEQGMNAVLARLDEPGPDPGPPPVHDAVLPLPISELVGPFDALDWKWLGPGMRGVDLPLPTKGLPLRLVKMSAGRALPHRHQGAEAGVVIAGGWSDQFGTFERGDAAFFPADIGGVHHQRIHADADCIALVLNERPALLPWPLGWLGGMFVKT